jgi:prepilin-type N-terminal cleavage/methylation domain-containing protein
MRRGRAAGFSLIELLAVLVILSILIVFLVTRLGTVGDVAKEKVCESRLREIAAAISQYEHEFGSFPPSRFHEDWGPPPNDINLGAEALVLALWSPEWGGPGISEDLLINTDGDSTKKPLSVLPTPDLKELRDPWDNPIAYIERSDYGRQLKYSVSSPETGEVFDSTVRAALNPASGREHNPTSFQLISAGLDGQFGTEDDIGNFNKP